MSVYYRSFIGFGWILGEDEVDKMNIDSNYEFEDDFISLDGYRGDLYFFGEKLLSIEPGEYQKIDILSIQTMLQYVTKNFRDILKRCGRTDLLDNPDETPAIYMINTVSQLRGNYDRSDNWFYIRIWHLDYGYPIWFSCIICTYLYYLLYYICNYRFERLE